MISKMVRLSLERDLHPHMFLLLLPFTFEEGWEIRVANDVREEYEPLRLHQGVGKFGKIREFINGTEAERLDFTDFKHTLPRRVSAIRNWLLKQGVKRVTVIDQRGTYDNISGVYYGK